MKITLADIPWECQTYDYICQTYQVSKTTAWRLLTGKSHHICPGYHKRKIAIADDGWEYLTDENIDHMRNIISYQLLAVWNWSGKYKELIDEIISQCMINAYEKSAIWSDMPREKQRAYLATLAKRTTNDHMKKFYNYRTRCGVSIDDIETKWKHSIYH